MANKSYTEETRLNSTALLIANGYPFRLGTLLQTQNKLGIDRHTLKRWFYTLDSTKLEKKIMELQALIEKELEHVFGEMQKKRESANYKELTTAAGILTDKLLILTGNVTNRTESISMSWKDLIEQARQDKPQETK